MRNSQRRCEQRQRRTPPGLSRICCSAVQPWALCNMQPSLWSPLAPGTNHMHANVSHMPQHMQPICSRDFSFPPEIPAQAPGRRICAPFVLITSAERAARLCCNSFATQCCVPRALINQPKREGSLRSSGNDDGPAASRLNRNMQPAALKRRSKYGGALQLSFALVAVLALLVLLQVGRPRRRRRRRVLCWTLECRLFSPMHSTHLCMPCRTACMAWA